MKISCENCGAKYSIADEKVKDKVFKIRCKKCSEVIVVKGTRTPDDAASPPQAAQEPAPAAAGAGAQSEEIDTRVYDYSGFKGENWDQELWHVVLDGNQVGPMSAAQIGEYLSQGSIDYDTYIWRDGFDDWVMLREVDELASVFSGQPAAPEGEHQREITEESEQGELFAGDSEGFGGFEESPASSPFGDDQASGGDLFGGSDSGGGLFDSPADSGGGDLFGAEDAPAPGADQAQAAGGGDLFSADSGQPDEDAVMSSAPVASRAQGHDVGADLFAQTGAEEQDQGLFTGEAAEEDLPDPRYGAASPAMTGARNENSVLFSLSNLQALASNQPAQESGGVGMMSMGDMAASSSPGPAAGHASGDASGLIDIRTMAEAISMDKQDKGGVEEILSIGGGQAFGGGLGAPVLAPTQTGPSKGLIIGLAAGGALLLAAVVVLVVVLLFKEEPDKTKVAQAPKPSAEATQALKAVSGAAGAEAKAGEGAKPGTADQKAAGEEASTEKENAKADENKDTKSSSSSRSRKSRSRSKSTSSSSTSKDDGDDLFKKRSTSSTKSKESSGAKTKGGDELDDLLSGAVKRKTAPPKKTRQTSAPTSSELSDTLSRSQVQAGMRAVKPAVERCGKGTPGTAMVTVSIAGATGRVTNATVGGQFAGTPVGSCVARAVRRARFPKFKRSKLTISYPFRVR